MDLLETTFYGNTIVMWLAAAGIVVGGAVLGKLLYWVFGNVVKRLTARTKTRFDDIVVDMVEEPAAFAVFLGGVWYATRILSMSDGTREWLGHAFQFVLILNVAWLIVRLFDALYVEYLVPIAEKSETDLDDQLLPIVRRGTKAAVWIVGIIVALNNAGYDVGAALAGLGIGGLALAMAGRDTVANMFGGLTIFMDQPFKLHDRVKVDGYDGVIRDIGLRSTRLQTLEGRVVTIPNAKFSDSCVENVSAEPSRKVASTIGLTYDTSPAQMREALAKLRRIGEEHEGTEDDVLVSFSGFGDFALNVLFIYYIRKEADILETQSEINLAILEQFADAGLDMAFPTQTIIHRPEGSPAPAPKPASLNGRAAPPVTSPRRSARA